MDKFQQCEVLSVTPAPNGAAVFSIKCENTVATILPGQYLFLALNDNLLDKKIAYAIASDIKRKNISLYITAEVLSCLKLQQGSKLLVSSPRGDVFPLTIQSKRLLFVADELGLPSVLFLSKTLAAPKQKKSIFVLLCSKQSFPFRPQPALFMIPSIPADMIAACPLLDDRGIANRLVCQKFLPGCYEGDVHELLTDWLPEYLSYGELTICASGQPTFLKSIVGVSDDLGVRSYLVELPEG